MKFVYFTHSLISDWNHGNAHFLRGVASELQRSGHEVCIYEPADAWSLQNLVQDHGPQQLRNFATAYPHLSSIRYDHKSLDLDAALEGADVVIVHEWNDPDLVAAIGGQRARGGHFHLLFHDTHHRAATSPDVMREYCLDAYDGVLAFGDVIRDIYLERGWAARAWTWHEAADTQLFRPSAAETSEPSGDLVWVGNWGDEERSEELRQFLIEPVRRLRLSAEVYGVRYPQEAQQELRRAGIRYRGWLANYKVPRVFSRFGCTIHIPRRPYRQLLPGVPTIRVFEALACGIPLICLRWNDSEGLFTPGQDYLLVDTPQQMSDAIVAVLSDQALREGLVRSGLQTIASRHTCKHRADELLRIVAQLTPSPLREEFRSDLVHVQRGVHS